MHVLTLATDYAIRSMIYLADRTGFVTAREISAAMSIPKSYAAQVLHALLKAGLVTTKKGQVGGYATARPASQVTVMDVMNVMDNGVRINRCLEDDHYCSRQATGYCVMHRVYRQVQDKVEETFRGLTLADLLKMQEEVLREAAGPQQG